jgi:hypothetical protein
MSNGVKEDLLISDFIRSVERVSPQALPSRAKPRSSRASREPADRYWVGTTPASARAPGAGAGRIHRTPLIQASCAAPHDVVVAASMRRAMK